MSPWLARALLWIPVAAAVAAAMDLWAALLHEVVWHGPLWAIHRSHHTPRRGRFEANDALSALHAPIAVALLLFGCAGRPGALREVAFGIGLGMTAFGLAYLVVHDGLAHGRLPVRFLLRSRVMRAIVVAHGRHHATSPGAAPYGLFFAPWTRRTVTTPPAVHGSTETAAPTTPRLPPSASRSTGRDRR